MIGSNKANNKYALICMIVSDYILLIDPIFQATKAALGLTKSAFHCGSLFNANEMKQFQKLNQSPGKNSVSIMPVLSIVQEASKSCRN